MSTPSLPPNVHVSNHPCLLAKLSQLRSKGTSAKEVKALIHEISLILGCEALASTFKTSPGPQVSFLSTGREKGRGWRKGCRAAISTQCVLTAFLHGGWGRTGSNTPRLRVHYNEAEIGRAHV